MKKLVKLAVTAVLALSVLSLVGCGNSAAPADEETTTEAVEVEDTDTEETTEVAADEENAEEETEAEADADADTDAEEATEEATEA